MIGVPTQWISSVTPQVTELALSKAATEKATSDQAASGRRNVPAEIQRAADGFESLFVAQLLAPLEKSGEAMFGSGPEGRTIGGLFRDQLANSVAQSRPLGVANLIEKELLARQAAVIDTKDRADLNQRAAELYRKASS